MLYLLFLIPGVFSVTYNLLQDFSGNTFFSDADGTSLWTWFSNWDNLTLGYVEYLSEEAAFSQELAYLNSEDRIILKVDNTTTIAGLNQTRNSVRITTREAYDLGSLWIVDMTHVPYGCSVWPAFWSVGAVWPDDGEIDTFEGINLQTSSQMVIHTIPGCTQQTVPADCSTDSGCIEVIGSELSYGASFATAGGGVFATQFDETGIFIWFWSRPNIPASVTQATSTSAMDISTWGPPTASYPSTNCSIEKYFGPQNIIFDITLCGVWAGVLSNYVSSCGVTTPTGTCYDQVLGNGSNFDEAYFEVSYLRTYTTGAVPSPTSHPTSTSTSPSGSAVPSKSNQASNNGAFINRGFSFLCVVTLIGRLLM